MFRFIIPIVFLFATSAAAEELQVESVNAIYRDRFDDVLFRVVFDTPPEFPFWWISFGVPDIDPNTGLPATAGLAIQANRLIEAGYMTLNYSGYVNGVYQRIWTEQCPYEFRNNVFESAVPFDKFPVRDREFWYSSMVVQHAGDDPIYNTAYSAINVPEPSGLVLAIIATCVTFLAASTVQRTKPPARQEFRA